MNSLPPLNVYDDKMLPAVVRRDVYRPPAVAGNRSLRGRSDEQIVALNDQISRQGYARLQNNRAPAVKSGACSKGMIIDVWA